ncbi:hypothetical protein [Sinanaerobacter chloroacetimidivorans]|nr:hypothetical protein [Sinanaerobacter chloroacetimidivorans]
MSSASFYLARNAIGNTDKMRSQIYNLLAAYGSRYGIVVEEK